MSGSTVDRIERDYPETRITELYEEGRQRIDQDLASFVSRHEACPDLLRARWEDVRSLILHVDERINYWENRRSQYLQFTAGILVAVIAALMTVLNSAINSDNMLRVLVLYLPIISSSSVLLYFSIRIIAIWNRQNNPSYPFTKGYRTWRWHYRHAEKHPLDTETSKYTAESFTQQVDYYVENLYQFKKRMLAADLTELLDQDLSHLYVLLTNEKFKVRFIGELRDALVASLSVALWAAISSLLVWLIYFGVDSGLLGGSLPNLGQATPAPQLSPLPGP